MNASMTCTRWAKISVTMWMTRNASAPKETARCTAWAITLCPGVITVRSVATRPTMTEAVRPMRANTPA